MQAPGGRIVVNPAFQDWVYEDDKSPYSLPTPMKRQITYRVQEEIGPTETKDDPWKHHDYQNKVEYGRGTQSTGGSSRLVLTLMSIVCSVSIAAFVLILLMLFGKIGEGCDCSANEGQYIGNED